MAGPHAGEQPGLEPPARRSGSWLPSAGYLVDFLPATLLFGLGLAITVAPLTTALMASVPENRAGLGSAVNNAISRVGPQLAGALIFVAITGAFYADLSSRVPGHRHVLRASSAQQVVAAEPARPGGRARRLVAAAGEASTDSFHLAMGIAAGLLLAGAVVNGIGIRDPQAPAATERVTADASDRRRPAARVEAARAVENGPGKELARPAAGRPIRLAELALRRSRWSCSHSLAIVGDVLLVEDVLGVELGQVGGVHLGRDVVEDLLEARLVHLGQQVVANQRGDVVGRLGVLVVGQDDPAVLGDVGLGRAQLADRRSCRP